MSPAVRCALAALVLLSAPALADDYDDFRIPDHRMSDWRAGLSASSLGGTTSSFNESETRARSGRITTSSFWLRDSDPVRTVLSIRADAQGSRTRSTQESDTEFTTSDEATKNTSANESWVLSGEHRWYPGEGVLGYTASISGRGNYTQNWFDRSTFATQDFSGLAIVDLAKDRSHQSTYSTQVFATLGIGAGRVRDATAVYDAQVLEQRLIESGALARPLSDAARRRLLALLYVRYAHRSILDRPGTALWREVAAILADDAAEGEVDPEAVLRAMEPHLSAASALSRDGIPVSPVLRQIGWFAGMTMDVNHGHVIQRSGTSSYRQRTVNDTLDQIQSFENSARGVFDVDQVGFGPLIEYHRPLGRRWQVDGRTLASFPIKDPAHGLRWGSFAGLQWLAADRWLAGFQISHARELQAGGTFEPVMEFGYWRASYTASLQYYVVDALELTLTAGENQGKDNRFFGNPFSRNGAISLGLTYRLMGRIEAPGLMEPVRVGAL